MALGKNRSPHQTFGRSPLKIPEFGDPDLLPKGEVRRPSYERNPFGIRRSGARGADLHPDGPGPLPEGFLTAEDVSALPWVRRRGDEWTDAVFRGLVLTWLREFVRDRPDAGIIGWEIVEKATGERLGMRRFAPDRQHLIFRVILRRMENRQRVSKQVETSIAFPPEDRDDPSRRLAAVAGALDALIEAL